MGTEADYVSPLLAVGGLEERLADEVNLSVVVGAVCRKPARV